MVVTVQFGNPPAFAHLAFPTSMKYPAYLLAGSIGLFLFLTGCVSSDIISTGPETYTVTASGAGFSTAGVREKVYKKANEFCAKKNLVMVPISFKSRPGELARHPPSADLTFKALKPGDPAIAGAQSVVDADQSISVSQKIDVSVDDKTKKQQDLYTELLKLDDLKKRGILTEVELEAAKQKVLQGK